MPGPYPYCRACKSVPCDCPVAALPRLSPEQRERIIRRVEACTSPLPRPASSREHFRGCLVSDETGEILLCHCSLPEVGPPRPVRRVSAVRVAITPPSLPRPAPLRVPVESLPPPVEVVREHEGPGPLVAAAWLIGWTLTLLAAFAAGWACS